MSVLTNARNLPSLHISQKIAENIGLKRGEVIWHQEIAALLISRGFRSTMNTNRRLQMCSRGLIILPIL